MRACFDKLAEELRAASAGRQIVYIPNPGNYGDGLIRYGTKQFLADYGFDHHELNVGYTRVRYQLLPFLAKDRLGEPAFFLYGGGGAWSPAYAFAGDICGFIDRVTPHFCVLPSTYALDRLPRRGLMYRRDEAESATYNPASRFCHDMALYIACRDSPGALYPAPVHETGLFMRTDRESRFGAAAAPQGNVDISMAGDHMSNGDDFIRTVAACETIWTDRLHVAIAGCLAGRRVKLMTGNYFKIRAIYDASLKPCFSDLVELVTADELPGRIKGTSKAA